MQLHDQLFGVVRGVEPVDDPVKIAAWLSSFAIVSDFSSMSGAEVLHDKARTPVGKVALVCQSKVPFTDAHAHDIGKDDVAICIGPKN